MTRSNRPAVISRRKVLSYPETDPKAFAERVTVDILA
jgi:hypothetical protein